ncbi:GNAT family N-acetyltransferase [Urechidicola vernalis]|uniref:GNAT family N-acetyltransferase n=1 Tax=Urechidicola vernalis TaxID=3075600 RepID=A0ABU2Y586_9FLAO|nr:GNAT family N-acetyltransferase [Urechidicola sp. P050]MDT0553353.1 GNAT family N-acetyltransferase [Urechidicola sp. P050]
MNYRKATLKDLAQLAQLFDAYRVFYRKETDIIGAKEFLTERFNQQDAVIFIAEDSEGQLTGFTQLYPLFSSTRMQKLWLLNDLFVNPNTRGKGVSKGLIEQAKRLVKESGACGMFLETEKSNTIGNNLYPVSGFKLNEGSNYYEWSV